MIQIKAPDGYSAYQDKTSVFLAGSIDMGSAVDWQAEVAAGLAHLDVLLLNPRREAWDASWVQSIDNPQFREQVEWELQALEDADIILFHFAPGTQSPITQMELGLHARMNPERLVVCCPEGFWRKGNVDIVCARYGVKRVASLLELIQETKKRIEGI